MLAFPRHVLVRLVRIDSELRSKKWPNATTLARLFEVTERTIHRDIDCLRDQLGAPIEYDSSRHGYYYREESYRLALPQVTEGECLALFLAERLLEQDQLVAVFPEGIKGIGKLYRERYQLQRFGRGGFIKLALASDSPIGMRCRGQEVSL